MLTEGFIRLLITSVMEEGRFEELLAVTVSFLVGANREQRIPLKPLQLTLVLPKEVGMSIWREKIVVGQSVGCLRSSVSEVA